MWENIVMHVSVFFLAAYLEILIAIPIGISLGINPILAGLISFSGNLLTVIIIVFLFEKLQLFYKKKKLNKQRHTKDLQQEIKINEKKAKRSTERRKRGKRIFDKYGLPGLAFFGPVVTGVFLATVIAVSLHTSTRAIIGWMSIGLAVWTVIMVTSTYYSIEWITSLIVH